MRILYSRMFDWHLGLGRSVHQPLRFQLHRLVRQRVHTCSQGDMDVSEYTVESIVSIILTLSQSHQGSRYRRFGQRMLDRTSAYYGRILCRLRLRFTSLPLPYLHISSIQLERRIHSGRRGVCFLDRSPNLPDLHHANLQRYRYHLCCCSFRPRGHGKCLLSNTHRHATNNQQIREHPELYERMVKTYPHVQQAIHA